MASLSIPIAKAGNANVEVDMDTVPDAVYQMALFEGMKVLMNKGMSKVGSVTRLEGEEKAKAHAKAMEIAEKNLDNIKAGKVKAGREASTAKVAGVVMTEARRLAKEVVKNTIRAAGMKVSHVEASAITKAANELIASDPSYVETAKANIESRAAKTKFDADAEKAKAEATAMLEKLGGVHESDKLVAKAEKDKLDKGLSAKQAGMVKPRKAQAVPTASLQ